jgi:hypothetical protein
MRVREEFEKISVKGDCDNISVGDPYEEISVWTSV